MKHWRRSPNFTSLLLPPLRDDVISLSYVDPNIGQDVSRTALAKELFLFPSGGVGNFLENGIETAIALNSGDVTAFMTEAGKELTVVRPADSNKPLNKPAAASSNG